jgi:serine O-acetyltransferase
MEREVFGANEGARETGASPVLNDHGAASRSTSPLKEDFLRTYALTSGNLIKRIIGCYRSPGLHAIVIHRFGQWLKRQTVALRILLEPVYLILVHRIRSKWGIEISRSAEIGAGFYIGHYGGITISGLSRIGRNVNISQLVTIGVSGQGEKRGAPTIGDNVYIAPGAKIFGKIHVGTNVKIGANTVVYQDIPDNAIIVLEPGFKIISFKGNRAVDE